MNTYLKTFSATRFLMIGILFVGISCSDPEELELKSEFVNFYVEAIAVDIQKTSDSGFLMAGQDTIDNFSLLVKVDAYGRLEWGKNVDEYFIKDLVNPENNDEMILVGDFATPGPDDIIIKFFERDNEISSFSPDLSLVAGNRGVTELYASQGAIDPVDGNLVISGGSNDQNGLSKPFIFKVDPNNNVQWIYELGQDDPNDHVEMAAFIISGNSIILAYNVEPVNGLDAFIRILSLDTGSGLETNLNTITGGRGDVLASEMISTSFGYALTGTGSSFSGTQEMSLHFLSPVGELLQNAFGNRLNFSSGNSISATAEGGFVMAGNVRAFNNNDFLLVRTDPTGAPVWEDERIMGGDDGNEIATNVVEVEDGFILFGTTWVLNAKPRLTLIKTNRLGQLYE